VPAPGQPGHDLANQHKQQDLKHADHDEEAKAYPPVTGGRQQRIGGKRETDHNDRRWDGTVHTDTLLRFVVSCVGPPGGRPWP
jgi:hypothetical protein